MFNEFRNSMVAESQREDLLKAAEKERLIRSARSHQEPAPASRGGVVALAAISIALILLFAVTA